MFCLLSLSLGSLSLLPGPSLGLSLSVSLSGRLFSFATAAEGLLHLTARVQLPGSANRILGLSGGCQELFGDEGH